MSRLHRGESIFDRRTSHTIRIHHTEIPAACSSASYRSTATTIGLSNTQIRTIQASAITTTVSSSFPTTVSSSFPTTIPSSFPTTIPSSLVCPTADKANYTATNRPHWDLDPKLLIPDTSLTYQVLCDTNFEAEFGADAAVDLQIVNNVTFFKDCLDASALYIFQTPAATLPSLAQIGLVWDSTLLVCWLKSNIILSEAKSQSPLYAAILHL